MKTRDPEYDRFGPWVIEISESDPPPPLFVPYLTRTETPLISVKVPRKIERRDARPGMNLYDYVVSLYREELVILERSGIGVRSEAFAYRDIRCVRYTEDLLRGVLRLGMAGTRYDLPFSTVSSALMRRVVDLIRRRYRSDDLYDGIKQNPDVAEEDLSFYFTGVLADHKARHPDLRVLAWQPETPVGSHETRVIRKLLLGVIGKTLLESMHLCNGTELIAIDRGQTYRYRGGSVYGTNTLFVPISKVAGAAWEPDGKNPAIVNLLLETNGGRFSYAFIKSNPAISHYARILAEVCTPDPGRIERDGDMSGHF